jgi:hypothetical protein
MNANNGSITQLPNCGVSASIRDGKPAAKLRKDAEFERYSRLLNILRHGSTVDPGIFPKLAERLRIETDPSRLWCLLSCVDHAPRPRLFLEERFDALVRLTASDSVFLRAAAYEWLAGLHRQDLRFEMRAKQVLRRGLDREQGLAETRLRRLMRVC